MADDHAQTHWKKNLRLVSLLLTVWFCVSYLAGIVFVEPLNTLTFLGFPLGFWFAQQGSIWVFVALIFVYVWRMNHFDRQFGVSED